MSINNLISDSMDFIVYHLFQLDNRNSTSQPLALNCGYTIVNATALVGVPSNPFRGNGIQTRKALPPIKFLRFELRFSIMPTPLDNNFL